MVSERAQRQIDRLLDEAEAAIRELAWDVVRARAEAVLTLDPENADGKNYLAAAERKLGLLGNVGQAPSPAPSPDRSAGVPPAPTSFANGRYQVKRFLGEGGKKRVYLAHDTTLDRDVAFALIKAEGLDSEGRERVQREAQAMGKLGTHPHIVSVFDMGSETLAAPSPSPSMGEGSGSPYLVTELMAGGDVEGLLEKADDHRLAIERAIELAVQVCRGLEFAHNQGLVHRDLKPGNVWLTADPSTGSGRAVAKIGDFGLAVSLDRSRLTRAGMMVGTVAYMPPEQAMGGEVTPRSDLYSLGAMLYEMVCGRPPFVGEESVAIITQHLNTPPVAPAWHRPDCPPGLEALITRLLEKDASKRPGSAAEVRQALEGVLGSPLPGGEGQGEGAPPASQPGPDNPLYRRTFVGREQELRQLQSAFDGALSGEGALVMVVGEPGIGKTALCEQAATYAAMRGGKALVGHCYEEGSLSIPYLPFVEAIRSYVLTGEPEKLRSELGSGATEVARIVSEVREKVAVELRAAGDPEDDRWRLYQAVTGFLRNASAVQPLLIVLEDLHWADRATLDFLLHLGRNLSGARLLIIGTYRDVEVDRAHPLSATLADLRRSSNFGRVPLRGLTVDEVHRMMNQLRGQEVPWSRAEAVHRQTEGNPLFIQEVLRYLVEEGLVVREGDRWVRSDGDDPAAGIPEGLRDVIGKRLSRLSAESNRVLAVAAVIGRDFDLAPLQVVAGASEDALMEALEEAVRVGVLESRSRPGVMRFRFTHAFFRQTLYEEIFAMRRVRLHQQVGRALEQAYGQHADEHAAELAEHFSQSTEVADAEKALAYSERAARRAAAVYAYGEAARHLERALQVQEVLDPDDRAKHCDLLLALGEALFPAGEPLRVVEETAPAAFELAEALGDSERAASAAWMGLQGLLRRGGVSSWGTPEFAEWASRADRHAVPGTASRLHADMALFRLNRARGEMRAASAVAQGALPLARQLGDPESIFQAGWMVMNPTMALRHAGERRAAAAEISDLPERGVSTRTLGQVLDFAGWNFLEWGERDRAEELWARLDGLAERTRDADVVLRANSKRIQRSILDGELEAAIELAGSYLGRAEELGAAPRGRQFAGGSMYGALRFLGRVDEARRYLGDSIGDSDRLEALTAWHAADHPATTRYLTTALRRFDVGSGQSDLPMTIVGPLLELATEAADRTSATLLLDELAPFHSLLAGPGNLSACLGRLLGGAAALLGHAEQARGLYAKGVDVCARARFRPEMALTRLQLAELLLEHYPDERAEALAHLDFAIAEFREMKMQPSLERALKHKGLLRA